MKMFLREPAKKALMAVALTGALGLASSSAMAIVLNDFTVAEGSVPGALVNTFVADKITGNYVEVISFTSATTFDVSLKWEAGQFVGNDGTVPVATSQLNGLGANNYGLYALYQGSGTFSTSGVVTTFTTSAGVGSLNVYIDPSQDTTKTQPGTGSAPWTTASNGDDYLIATGVPQSGLGTLDPSLSTCGGGGINCGSFGTSTTFALEIPAGSNFFTLPNPFYNLSFQSGQLNNFDVSGTQVINGSMDVVFTTVPEPGTLALLGVGLLGAGVFRRRKGRV